MEIQRNRGNTPRGVGTRSCLNTWRVGLQIDLVLCSSWIMCPFWNEINVSLRFIATRGIVFFPCLMETRYLSFSLLRGKNDLEYFITSGWEDGNNKRPCWCCSARDSRFIYYNTKQVPGIRDKRWERTLDLHSNNSHNSYWLNWVLGSSTIVIFGILLEN